ncbi:MAG: hypothetical protein ACTSRS_03955 [Candidatus Helarchaeota archaeon]
MAADDIENIEESLIADMGKGYRFRPFMQVVIMAVIVFITALILYLIPNGPPGMLDFQTPGELTIVTLSFCWVLAFLFPFIAKARTHRVKQISMGIFFGAVLSLASAIILMTLDQGISSPSIALLIAFLVGVGAQLFEHLNPEAVKRNAWMYMGIFLVAAVFFVCIWIYMEALLTGWGIWISIVITALFAYALLPEKPK